MFSVPTRVRYGIRALARLLETDLDDPVPVQTLAKQEGISRKYLENIFIQLRKAGIVRSTRGPEGGYSLAVDPRELNAYKILEALDGPVMTVECLHEERCERIDECTSRKMWVEFQVVIETFLKEKSLQDIANNRRSAE